MVKTVKCARSKIYINYKKEKIQVHIETTIMWLYLKIATDE